MSHFTNISTVASCTRGHGFQFGKGGEEAITFQGDVGWGIRKREPTHKRVLVVDYTDADGVQHFRYETVRA